MQIVSPERQFAWNVKPVSGKNKKSIAICRLVKTLSRVIGVNLHGRCLLFTKAECMFEDDRSNMYKELPTINALVRNIEMYLLNRTILIDCLNLVFPVIFALNQRRFNVARCDLYVVERFITKTCLFKYIENFTTKSRKFSGKNSYIFHISARNIDCRYSLEPPRRGGSNEYPQSMFLSRNKKNNVYPCKPQFYYTKVGSKLYLCMFPWWYCTCSYYIAAAITIIWLEMNDKIRGTMMPVFLNTSTRCQDGTHSLDQ